MQRHLARTRIDIAIYTCSCTCIACYRYTVPHCLANESVDNPLILLPFPSRKIVQPGYRYRYCEYEYTCTLECIERARQNPVPTLATGRDEPWVLMGAWGGVAHGTWYRSPGLYSSIVMDPSGWPLAAPKKPNQFRPRSHIDSIPFPRFPDNFGSY